VGSGPKSEIKNTGSQHWFMKSLADCQTRKSCGRAVRGIMLGKTGYAINHWCSTLVDITTKVGTRVQ